MEYDEKAIRLISVDESGKYILQPEGQNFIRKIQSPIAVISVAGLYRTGKSYLLNRMLLNRSNGFGVGPTINPCTKGLWCWGTPIKGTTHDGEKVNVIIIDTEGIGALDEDQNHDTRIFTLAILLASSFIYNSVGSIDENAVQNLSLVVNLTKHIQLRSQQSEEQDDPDEMAQYFPSFFWVIRDFSLQLISSDGQPLSSKEYLERALAPQKGFSDDVEQKNRIRRLLVSFFKERECFTLVRPVIIEQQIQHLDKLDFDELRPEFVDQVLNFRRKILGRVKPKTIKGKNLDGQMYANLINSYVSAINNGAVPNIQNAWNYMCNEKCSKLMDQSLDFFTKNVRDIFSSNFPCPQEQFYMVCDRAKQLSYQMFEKNSVGDNSKQYFIELRKKIKGKIKNLKMQNEKESGNVLKSYIMKNFTSVQKRLKLDQFKCFQDFVKGVNSFYVSLLQNGPNLPQKQIVYLDFLKKILPQGGQIFIRKTESEFEKHRILSQESVNQLEKTIEISNQQYKNQINNLKEQNITKEKQNAELSLKLEKFSLQIQQLIQKYQIEAGKIENNSKEKIHEMEKRQIDYQATISVIKQKLQVSQGEANQLKKQLEKQKAVNQLKIKQLSNELQQVKSRQRTIQLLFEKTKSQMESSKKQSALKFQKKLSELQYQSKESKEKQNQLIQYNNELQQNLRILKQQKLLMEEKLKQSLKIKQKDYNKLRNEYESVQTNLREQFKQEKQRFKSQLAKITSTKDTFELQCQNLKQISKVEKSQYEKSLAILNQKIQFLQMNLVQNKQEITRMKSYYENQLQTIQQSSSQRLSQLQISRIQEVEEQNNRTIKSLQVELQNHKKKHAIQLQGFKKVKHQLEFQIKLLSNNNQTQVRQLKDIITKLQQKLQYQIQSKNQTESKINQTAKIQQHNYIRKIKELQIKVQQIKQNSLNQQRQYHSKSQEYVMQLKNYYELEKQKLQQKLCSEKQKYEKRVRAQAEQYEGRLQDETGTIQQEYEQLKNDYINMQTTLQQALSKLQHQSDIKAKNIQNLQRLISDLKQKLEKNEKDTSNKIDKISHLHQSQKETLYNKIDELNQQKNKSQKEIMSIIHLKDKLQNNLQKKQSQLIHLIEEMNNIKSTYQINNEEYRSKLNEKSNQFMEEKVNYEKIIALSKQQNQFYQKKIKEVEKNYQSITVIYEEKIKKIKEQVSNDLQSQLQKHTADMNSLEQKYERLKKTSKENQMNMSKIINNHQKQRAIERQKYSHLQSRLKQFEDMKINESQNHHSQLLQLKNTTERQKKQFQDSIAQLKRDYSNIESQKNTILNLYDKDKVLWDNKIKFLEQNKQKNKKQYMQNTKKLELMIQNLQKTKSIQKSQSQNAHNDHIAKIQKRNWIQLQELNENFNKKQAQSEQTIKRLSNQLRTVSEKLAFEQQNRVGNQVVSERRVKQLIENQKRLTIENQKLKAQKENQNTEYSLSFEKDKENLKNKLLEKEQKVKAMEKAKQNMFFEFQKQRAKWNLQKESLAIRQDQLKDTISKNERDLQKLQRQNQKLRVQKKCNKMSLPGANRYSNYSLQRGLSRSSLQQTINRENYSPLLGDLSFFKNQ